MTLLYFLFGIVGFVIVFGVISLMMLRRIGREIDVAVDQEDVTS